MVINVPQKNQIVKVLLTAGEGPWSTGPPDGILYLIIMKYCIEFCMRAPSTLKQRTARLIAITLSLMIALVLLYIVVPPRSSELYPAFNSYKILDRNGRVLREILSKDYKTGTWVPISGISPHMLKATIIREDRRFFLHPGVDLFAISRAFINNIRYGRITSGGSTITMQVAKFCLGVTDQNILTKFQEILYALKLELYLNKSKILEIYLNRAPYANLTYGVEAASAFYFRKKSQELSLGEASILTAIPKSPSRYDPYINPVLVREEKERILDELLRTKVIDDLSFGIAVRESLNILGADINFEAPHFVDFVIDKMEKNHITNCLSVTTTIDADIQRNVSKISSTSLKTLSEYNVNQAAVIVLDRRDGEIIAMVGSKDYFDSRDGQVNGCVSLRQPGSSIKPFLYILALESGVSVNSILPDTIWEFKLPDKTVFAPRNFGNKYHGPTRVREALGSSFNVPTVYLLEKIGPSRFFSFLKELDFRSLNRNAAFYGLSLGLGSGEVTLLEMVNAYRAIARAGMIAEPRSIRSIRTKSGDMAIPYKKDRKIFSPCAAYIITDILSDNGSRIKAFGDDSPMNLPFPCAVKTGTTKDYKDNWCVGFTTSYIVGVWVGNFDAAPMQGVSGVSGAAPLFRDIMIELHRRAYPTRFPEPPNLTTARVCGKTGLIARNECPVKIDEIFIPGTVPHESCAVCQDTSGSRPVAYLGLHPALNADNPLAIINPSSGDIYKINPQVSYRTQGIKFIVETLGDIGELDFMLDGRSLGKIKYPYVYVWSPVTGEHVLEVVGRGQSDRITFQVF